MDVRFPAFQQLPIQGAPGAPGARTASGAVAETDSVKSFSGVLNDALHGASKLHDESQALQRRFLMGAEGASLEQTMVAMQRSQVAFQAALTVRNRLVAAYTDIMNMPV